MVEDPETASIGLMDVAKRGDLRRQLEGNIPQRYMPSSFDLNVLRVAERAIATRLPTALVLPIPGTTTAALLAASILVAHVVRTRTLTAKIALVTKQTHLRSFYNSLCCGSESLHHYFPASLILPSGKASDISEQARDTARTSGRLYFTPDLDRIRLLLTLPEFGQQGLQGIVIESQATDEANVRQILGQFACAVPIIYLTIDPNDPVLAYFNSEGAVWAWNANGLRTLMEATPQTSKAICASPSILRAAASAGYRIESPDTTNAADSALARLWDDLTIIQRHPGGPGFETVRWVWSAFNALCQLAVPIETYDRYARSAWGTTTLADSPVKANAYAKNALRAEDREYWNILAADLEDAIKGLQRTSSKPQALAEWVTRRVDLNQTGVIVVRNRPGRQSVEEYLQTRPDVPFGWASKIEIVTLSEFASGRATSDRQRPPDTAIVPGPISERYGALLAFPLARAMTVLALGPWEAGRAARQVEHIIDRVNELACGAVKYDAVARLFDGHNPGPVCLAEEPKIDRVPVPTSGIPRTSRDAVWDPFTVSIIKSMAGEASDTEGPAKDDLHGLRDAVDALRITFVDDIGFFEPGAIVSMLDGEEIRDIAAKALKPGNRVILIDGGAKKDLFELIVEKLEDLPEFEATAMLVLQWQERVRRGFLESHLTYQDILTGMWGTTITTPATVGHWVRGTVHGPLDPKDIARFGRVVHDDFLIERWEPIGRALATMRAHRRKLGRMLAAALVNSRTSRLDDGYFDRRMGIHLSDLTAAVSVHEVCQTSPTTISVPYMFANRLLHPEEASMIAAQRGH